MRSRGRGFETHIPLSVCKKHLGKCIFRHVWLIFQFHLFLSAGQLTMDPMNDLPQFFCKCLSSFYQRRPILNQLHVQHIQRLSERVLEKLLERPNLYHITAELQDNIPLASALHDIGKIAIDEKILNKPGCLTPEEFEIVKEHTVIGSDMLRKLENFNTEPLLQTAYSIARWHHERWDGCGYPDGLKENEIPIEAQIVSLADVYDALTSERCYKRAYSHKQAVQMILNGECGAFNPILLECFVEIEDDLERDLNEERRLRA